MSNCCLLSYAIEYIEVEHRNGQKERAVYTSRKLLPKMRWEVRSRKKKRQIVRSFSYLISSWIPSSTFCPVYLPRRG